MVRTRPLLVVSLEASHQRGHLMGGADVVKTSYVSRSYLARSIVLEHELDNSGGVYSYTVASVPSAVVESSPVRIWS